MLSLNLNKFELMLPCICSVYLLVTLKSWHLKMLNKNIRFEMYKFLMF